MDRQTPVNTLLSRNFVCGRIVTNVNILKNTFNAYLIIQARLYKANATQEDWYIRDCDDGCGDTLQEEMCSQAAGQRDVLKSHLQQLAMATSASCIFHMLTQD